MASIKSESPEAYGSLLRNLVRTKVSEDTKAIAAEEIIAKAFSDELQKIAFGGPITKLIGGTLLAQGVNEGMNRLIYGNEAGRSPSEFLGDAAKSLAIHAPFAAAHHYGLPKLEAITNNPQRGYLAKGLSYAGQGVAHAGNFITNPAIDPTLRGAGNYAAGLAANHLVQRALS